MQRDLPRQRGQPGSLTFDAKLENEEELLETLLTALARNQLPQDAWTKFHLAAVRDDRLSEVAFSYEAVSQGKRLKTLGPPIVAEFLYRASTFFSDAFGDELGAVGYLERALAALPTHAAAFERLVEIHTKSHNDKGLAELYANVAAHRPKLEQVELLKRAAQLFAKDPASDDKATDTLQQVLRLDPHDEATRDMLELRLRKANRHRDVARLAEQALTTDPPPSAEYAVKVRGRLIELYAVQLHEPERSMPHIEALLTSDPSHEEARKIAQKLLDVKGLAARAASALAAATEQTGVPADVAKFLGIELEHTRGPKRREVLRKIGVLRQERLGDAAGAYEAFEQALALDPSDEDLRKRYADLAGALGKDLDAARTLSRVGTTVKDPALKARLTAELGRLYMAGGDAKRARATFAGVLAIPDVEPAVNLIAARALCSIFAAEKDYRSLADALERVATLEPDDTLRQIANEELAELAGTVLHDAPRAIGAWRRLVPTAARARALEALEPLYEASGDAIELAHVLDERSRDATDAASGRALAFRAAEVLTTRVTDAAKASAAWRRVVDGFGPARDVYARWLPLLASLRQWPELAAALEAEAELAPPGEKATVYAKLGVVRLQKTRDLSGAIDAFRRALDFEPAEKTSRSALEKLLAAGELRLAVADVLEPFHRRENNVAGLLRVLDARATLSGDADARLSAIEEAATLSESSPHDHPKAVDWAARGLSEAVSAKRPLAAWLERVDRLAPTADAKKRAVILARAMGGAAVDSAEMLHLAKKVAEAMAASGDVASALAEYRRALAFEPSSTELLSRVDDLLREQGSPGERVQLYRAALERGPGPERRRELLHKIGSIQRADVGDRAGAIETYRQAVADDAADVEARSALEALYGETEEWDLLMELLEDELARATGDAAKTVRAKVALLAAHHGQVNKARDNAKKLLAEPIVSRDGLSALEQVADALDDATILREVLQRRAASSEDPREQSMWLGKLGLLELSHGTKDDAVTVWKRAAQIAQKSGDDDTARRLYDQVLGVVPRDGEAALQLADLYEKVEKWDRLPELYSILLEHTHTPSARVSILMRHARVLADKMDDTASALVSAAQAFELATESSEYRDVLSTFTALALQGKATHIFAQAMDDAVVRNAGESPERAAQRADLHMAKARVLSANKDGRDAASAAYRAILDDPGVDEGRLKAALQAFEMLLSREPPGAWLEERRWLLSWKADHAPEEGLAAALLAWASAEEATFGDLSRALELYRRVEGVDPENADVLAAVSRLALATGDTGGAIAALAARRDRSEGAARNALDLEIATILLYRTDRTEEAIEPIDAVLRSAPHDEAALSLAAQLLNLPKAHAKAVAILERAEAVAEDPNQRSKILRHLLDARTDPPDPRELRQRWYERLLDVYHDQGRLDLALATALNAVEELPVVDSLLDRAEALARELETPSEVAELYHRALAQPLPSESAQRLGRRAVAFHEEWFEDPAGVVRILERVLEVDMGASWAFDRLKLLFDAAERWDDLFALFDRAIAAASDATRAALYEDAAQIAKDFANNSDRAIGYLEKLLPLKPGDPRLAASLERLYERQGSHRELIELLSSQLTSQPPADARKTRARIARLWLDEIGDAASALVVIEDMLPRADGSKGVRASGGEPLVFELLEKVLAIAPPHVESRATMPPAMEGERGRRDSVPFVKSGKRMPVRQRAAALLRGLYAEAGRDIELVRILEVELEAIKSVKELIRRHREIAEMYVGLKNDEAAVEHLASLVLLEPAVLTHRDDLAEIAGRIGRYDRLAEVLSRAAEDCHHMDLKVRLLMQAADVHVSQLGDAGRGIELFLRVLSLPQVATDVALEAARKVEPLLEAAGRSWERLDVNEQIAGLQADPETKAAALMAAARLASDLGEAARAIVSLEARLDIGEDADALDMLVALLEKERQWADLIASLDRRANGDRADVLRRLDLVRIAHILEDELHDTDAAIRAWRRVDERFGETDESSDALVSLLSRVRRWDELSDLLRRAEGRAEIPSRRAELLRKLGDVQRTELDERAQAVLSYEGALAADPKNEAARAGLRALIEDPALRAASAAALMRAYGATDEWELTLALTDHRLAAADGARSRVRILSEAATLAEGRGRDARGAFLFAARAFLEAPSDAPIEAEMTRLAEATGQWEELAAAQVSVLASRVAADADAAFRAGLRFRLGDVLETRLEDAERALAAYAEAAADAPSDIGIARAMIRVAARARRWGQVASALVGASRALGIVPADLAATVETFVVGAEAWNGVTSALGAAIDGARDLPPSASRDLEARLGEWHRDRRGDPDLAEAAFARALASDGESPELLASLAQIQRRAKGRPLIDSLLRLSRATGGDLDLLREAAEISINVVKDRGLAKTILESLHALAKQRWLAAEPAAPSRRGESLEATVVTVGVPVPHAPAVQWAMRELVRIYEGDENPQRMLAILVETAELPFESADSRSMMHDAARIARDKLGDPDRAIELYLSLFERDSGDAEAVSALTALYESAGRRAELLALERRRVADAPTAARRVELRLAVARIERLIGDDRAAVSTLHENLAESPRHEDSFQELASLLQQTQRFDELVDLFARQAGRALEANDPSAAADAWQAAAELADARLSDAARAIGYYENVARLEERSASLDPLARLLASRGEHGRAAEVLERLRVISPERRAALTLRLAESLSAAGRRDLARQRLEEATKEAPDEEAVRATLAVVYESDGAWEPLASLVADGAAHAPDKAARLSRLLRAADLYCSRCARPEAAIPLLEQAADLEPAAGAIRLALADALGAAGRFPEARTMLRAIIQGFGGRRPKERAPAHYHLARLELKMGDRARALVELDAATRIDPANPQILRALAELARDDGQLDRAERSYRALLVALPRAEDSKEDAPIVRTEVLLELSAVAERQGESDRSREILESALECGARSTAEGERLEQALLARGDYATLVRSLETRLAVAEGSPAAEGILSRLADALDVHLGHLARAFAVRLRTVTLAPSSPVAHEAALGLARRTDGVSTYVEEVERLAEAAERDGDVVLAGALLVRLGQVAETDLRDDRRAARLYERAQSFHLAEPAAPDPAMRRQEVAILRALDLVYERLSDSDAQGRILARRAVVESSSDDAAAAADVLYRLAALRLSDPATIDEGSRLLEQAFEDAPDHDRAAGILKAAAASHPSHARVVSLYERVGRGAGHERTLVEALALRSALEGGAEGPIREAVAVAKGLGDSALAESLLRRFISERESEEALPRAAWALVELAALRESAGAYADAVALKERAAEVADPEEARRIRFESARLASTSLGDLELAARLYEALLAQDPADRDAWEPLLDVQGRLGHMRRVADLLGEVVTYVDEPALRSKLRLDRVRVMMAHLGLGDDAAPALREIVEEDPSQVDAAILLAGILERRGELDELAALLARQLDAAKDRQDAGSIGSLSLRLGNLLEKKDRLEAKNVLYAGLDWVPEHVELLDRLAGLHELEGETADRADLLERRLALTSGGDAETLALVIHGLRTGEGDEKGAERALEAGFRRSPTSRRLIDELDRLYRERGALRELAALYAADARGRADGEARRRRLREAAEIHQRDLGDAAGAAGLLAEARSDALDDPELLDLLVKARTEAKQWQQAIDEVSTAMDPLDVADPRRVALLSTRASLRIELDDDRGAIADIDEASRRAGDELAGQMAVEIERLRERASARGDDATERMLRLRLASLLPRAGDGDGARAHLADLVRRDPKDRDALRALALVDESAERWDAVTATYRKLVALEEGEGVVDAAIKLADACERAGRLQDARGALERARAVSPQDPGLRDRLARLYEVAGAYKELAEMSLADAQQAKDVAGRFAHLVRAGSLLVQHGSDPNVAIAALDEAHALRPSDMECIVLLADAYTLAGRTAEAIELVNVAIASHRGKRSRELASLYHRLARAAHALGDRPNEMAWLASALDMDAQNGFVAAELATLALEHGQLDLATRALRAITLLKDPVSAALPKAVAYQKLGEIAREQGDVKRAVLLLRRAVDDDPTLQSARALLDALQGE